MSNSALTAVALAALLLAVLAVLLALVPLRDALSRRRGAGASPLPTDVAGLRREVEQLRSQVGGGLRHVAVVRYDAFGDMGGRLSWSLALADDRGDGVVLTSISGRSDARTYAKNLTRWSSEQALSPEEEEAVTLARQV